MAVVFASGVAIVLFAIFSVLILYMWGPALLPSTHHDYNPHAALRVAPSGRVLA